MESTTISVKIDKEIYNQMKMHDYLNWSALIRRALAKELEQIERINIEKAKKAVADINRIRESRVFKGGTTGVEIIREWRNKRK